MGWITSIRASPEAARLNPPPQARRWVFSCPASARFPLVMINGTTLIERGWPAGPLIGQALALVSTLTASGLDESAVLAALARIHDDPQSITAGEAGYDLAQALVAHRHVPPAPEVRAEPLAAPVWGRDLIDAKAIGQMNDAMRLPVTVAGALMPDAHVGYGIPIGGVVALENAVAPYMVGVDIACRMMLSVYPGDALAYLDEEPRRQRLRTAMREESRFGIGARFKPGARRSHAVLDDPDWNETPLLKSLHDKAYAQLGTSGTGNHFVDAGRIEVGARGGAALGVEPGTYFAVLTHSGSRGVGATIADRYSKLARTETPLPRELQALAWFGLDSELGQEYWTSMNLAGRFASACHHTLHEALGAALGLQPLATVENHHNFAWKETHVSTGRRARSSSTARARPRQGRACSASSRAHRATRRTSCAGWARRTRSTARATARAAR